MAVALVSGLLMIGCAHKHRAMTYPEVEILNTVSVDNVKTVVGRVARVVGWKVESETPGLTVASIQKESLYAKINIEYTAKQVTIRYVDSKNLNYKNISGRGETIHSRYLNWVNHLAEMINRAINSLPTK